MKESLRGLRRLLEAQSQSARATRPQRGDDGWLSFVAPLRNLNCEFVSVCRAHLRRPVSGASQKRHVRKLICAAADACELQAHHPTPLLSNGCASQTIAPGPNSN